VRAHRDGLDRSLARLRDLVRGEDHAYYGDLICFMTGGPLSAERLSRARWVDGPETTPPAGGLWPPPAARRGVVTRGTGGGGARHFVRFSATQAV
jgi:hypothetical protein